MTSPNESKNMPVFGVSGSTFGSGDAFGSGTFGGTFTFGKSATTAFGDPTSPFRAPVPVSAPVSAPVFGAASMPNPTFTFGSVASGSPMSPFGSVSSSDFGSFRSDDDEKDAEPVPFITGMDNLIEAEVKRRAEAALDENMVEIDVLKQRLSEEKEKLRRHEAKFSEQNAEMIQLRRKVDTKNMAIARYRKAVASMDMERTRVVHRVRAPTCGDSGGVTHNGYACQRNSFLNSAGRCKDH